MKITKKPDDNWVENHRAIWSRKSGLRDYYQTQIFDQIISEMNDGATLQLGTGPGLFARYHPGTVNSDITNHDGVDMVADVHNLMIEDASFNNVVGVDVFHHFASPGLALRECSRVLRPGGKIILVEPWAGPIGWLFYKYIHHEDCAEVPDPWNQAFPDGKNPMDGNGAIPAIVLHKRASELINYAPNLRILKVRYFGVLSIILTGGFQDIGLPAPFTRFLYKLENRLPQPVLKFFALRSIYVLENRPPY